MSSQAHASRPNLPPRPAANSNLHLPDPITLKSGPFLDATSCFLTDKPGRGGATHGGAGATQNRDHDLPSATPNTAEAKGRRELS